MMRLWKCFANVCLFGLLVLSNAKADEIIITHSAEATNARTFSAKGVVVEIRSAEDTVVIQHEAISNFMGAMTMPFKVKDPEELWGLAPGDKISFKLKVTETESWVDFVSKTGTTSPPKILKAAGTGSPPVNALSGNPLFNYKFTNEFGQAVRLNDFRGQALGITFFYTRCPLPEYCPRLSKNFQDACRRITAATNAPSNWHFLSISFDTEVDTPEMLRAYGQLYQYDPAHWSFLTGPKSKVAELAQLCGVNFEPDGYLFNHNFRTLIWDATGQLQMVFPTTGDLSDNIVEEMLTAAAATNRPPSFNQK
jgi:protein SCO1/2